MLPSALLATPICSVVRLNRLPSRLGGLYLPACRLRPLPCRRRPAFDELFLLDLGQGLPGHLRLNQSRWSVRAPSPTQHLPNTRQPLLLFAGLAVGLPVCRSC